MVNEWGRYLEKLLQNVPIENYDWVVFGMNEILIQDLSVDFLPFGVHKGEELAQKLAQNEHYIIYLCLWAYPKDHAVLDEIENYEDFLKSSSEFAVTIADSTCTCVYVKNESDLRKFEEIAKKNHFTDVEYITPENDWYRESLGPR
jgi:hypothetical protein